MLWASARFFLTFLDGERGSIWIDYLIPWSTLKEYINHLIPFWPWSQALLTNQWDEIHNYPLWSIHTWYSCFVFAVMQCTPRWHHSIVYYLLYFMNTFKYCHSSVTTLLVFLGFIIPYFHISSPPSSLASLCFYHCFQPSSPVPLVYFLLSRSHLDGWCWLFSSTWGVRTMQVQRMGGPQLWTQGRCGCHL